MDIIFASYQQKIIPQQIQICDNFAQCKAFFIHLNSVSFLIQLFYHNYIKLFVSCCCELTLAGALLADAVVEFMYKTSQKCS